MPTPLLILSDAPTAGSGLGRITRDLATRIHANLSDVFRVGTLGCFGPYSRSLPFAQYGIEMDDWIVGNLPEVWKDFADDGPGIILTIWDMSRLQWFARPEMCEIPRLQNFLDAHRVNERIEKWGYFPLDATGPNSKLTASLKWIMEGYNRVLAYSSWAQAIFKRTCPTLDIDWLPHGVDTSVFYPRPRFQARHSFGNRLKTRWFKGPKKGGIMNIPDDAFVVGIVATNQERKDWGLGIRTVVELKKDRRVFLWCKTDRMEHKWSLPSLINDFNLRDDTVVTLLDYSDEDMAWAYSACDVTLGIGTGEGFGFPIFESLACGTPCIHGNDGGAPEHMPKWMLVEPKARRMEGPYNAYRNIYDPYGWAEAVNHIEVRPGLKVELPAYLDWNNLWPRWAEWLKAGVK